MIIEKIDGNDDEVLAFCYTRISSIKKELNDLELIIKSIQGKKGAVRE